MHDFVFKMLEIVGGGLQRAVGLGKGQRKGELEAQEGMVGEERVGVEIEKVGLIDFRGRTPPDSAT